MKEQRYRRDDIPYVRIPPYGKRETEPTYSFTPVITVLLGVLVGLIIIICALVMCS